MNNLLLNSFISTIHVTPSNAYKKRISKMKITAHDVYDETKRVLGWIWLGDKKKNINMKGKTHVKAEIYGIKMYICKEKNKENSTSWQLIAEVRKLAHTCKLQYIRRHLNWVAGSIFHNHCLRNLNPTSNFKILIKVQFSIVFFWEFLDVLILIFFVFSN